MDNTSKMQNIFLENRNRLSITGVLDVLNFDEEIVTVVTELRITNNKRIGFAFK